MQKENNNSRSAFLKKVALGLVSVFGLGVSLFGNKRDMTTFEDNFKTISEKDANYLIRSIQSPKPKQLKPEPPPDISSPSIDR